MGRAFKSQQLNRITSYEKKNFTIYCELIHDNKKQILSVYKQKHGKGITKLNYSQEKNHSQLTKTLPIQVFNPESIAILSSGSKLKRKLIDWGAFYNEQSFHKNWQLITKLTKQRNAALKQGYTYEMMSAWDKELSRISTIMDIQRKKYFYNLLPIIESLLHEVPELPPITIQYDRGWDSKKELSTVLYESFNYDKRTGISNFGAHKADLIITSKNIPVQDSLSRGQQKLLMAIIKLSQGALFEKEHLFPCVYLIDDITSEFDSNFLRILINKILLSKSQLFISTLFVDSIKQQMPEGDFKQFQVINGKIK
jgi:DNA replication and repair protein RecF